MLFFKTVNTTAQVGTLERRVFVDLARQKALSQRAIGKNPDPQFFQGWQHCHFKKPPPE